MNMATFKRLADKDVAAIFDSLHFGKEPPPHLDFHIVPVGPTGLKLSPPSYEFEDGLYVLLKPEKKKGPKPKAPDHLKDLVLQNLPPETCPWSLSGPQFPSPEKIQQRYCYPRGREEYSSRKGGALWTLLVDGKEDVEYRLLHVYASPKRAANKGVSLDQPPRKRVRGQAAAKTPPRPIPRPHRQWNHTQLYSAPLYDLPPTHHHFVASPPHPGYGYYPPPPMPPPPPQLASPHYHVEPTDSPHDDSSGSTSHLSPTPRQPGGDVDPTLDRFPITLDATGSFHELDSVYDPFWVPHAEDEEDSLSHRLERLQHGLCKRILAAPKADQPALIRTLRMWALQISRDPLGRGDQQQQQTDETNERPKHVQWAV